MEPKPERLRLIGARSNPAGVDSALKFGGRSHPRILHIIAVALLLAGILASPASAKTSAECGGGFVNGSTGGPGGTPLPYSTCSDDAACMNDWTCAESEPTKVYVKSTNSFCMTDLNPERCCWEYIELLTCPGGAACQRPSIPTVYDPYNRVSAWCGCAFTVDVTATIDADTVTFTAVPYDECGISPYTYLWVFEDAQTSTAQNPVYTYPAAGDYTVTLTVTDAAPDPDTTHVSQNVIISEVGPPADFEVELTYTPENPDPGQEVTFTAKAGGGAACKPYGYVFDFGDGSATESVTGEAGDAGSWEEKPVTHSYSVDGTYAASVTVVDCVGGNEVTGTVEVVVGMGALPADFEVALSADPTNPAPDETVTFTAKAGGGAACKPYGYVFDFGDGSATESVTGEAGDAGSWEEKPVTHSYSVDGTYAASVTVVDCGGENEVTGTVDVTVAGGEYIPPDITGAGLKCDEIIAARGVSSEIIDLIRATLCILWRIIQGIVAVLAALVIALAGLRWLSTDNPEQRDKAKKMIASAIVGATIIIIALQLANVLVLKIGWTQFDCSTVSGEEDITQNVVDVACVLFTIIQAIAAIMALVVIVLAGIKWATSDEPEGRAHAKSLMMGAIVGLVIILIAGNFVRAMFFGDDNALMGNLSCSIEESEIDEIKTQIENIGCMLFVTAFFSIGIIVSLVIVLAGIRWMSSESPEDRNAAKRWLIHALVGIVIVMVASQLIWAMTSVLFGIDFETPYVITCLSKLITHNSVWLLIAQIRTIFCIFVRSMQALAAVVAVMYITIAGLQLVGTDDPDSRTEAKRKIFHVLVGFMIAMIALSIVDAIPILAMLSSLFGDIPLIGDIIDFLSKFLGEEFLCPGFAELGGIYFVEQIQFIFCILIKIIQLAAVILAGIVIMLSGIKWSTSDDLESRTEAKTRIAYALLGLVVIILALQVVHVLMGGAVDLQDISPVEECEIASPGGDIEAKSIYLGCVIVRIMQACAALISSFVIVLAGIRWMSTDTPEDKSNAKSYIIHALIGLAIVVIALQLVNTMVNGTDITDFNPGCAVPEDIKNAVWEIGCNLIKIIQFVVGLLGALVIIVGGLMWVSSGGDVVKRTQAKAIIIAALIGVLIVLIGMQLANMLVTGTDVLTITCP